MPFWRDFWCVKVQTSLDSGACIATDSAQAELASESALKNARFSWQTESKERAQLCRAENVAERAHSFVCKRFNTGFVLDLNDTSLSRALGIIPFLTKQAARRALWSAYFAATTCTANTCCRPCRRCKAPNTWSVPATASGSHTRALRPLKQTRCKNKCNTTWLLFFHAVWLLNAIKSFHARKLLFPLSCRR